MKKKKNSAMKKLIPATSMLLVSATMLTASTYAWFTMSREVEVQNIKLTATVPADMQISLGALTGITVGQGHGLGDDYGTLNFEGTNADNGAVMAPDDTAEYWANTADISKYYTLGKIMPASSTDGKKIFFTPDSSGVGKTLKAGAQYYTAVDGATKSNDAQGKSRETTLHAFTSTEKTGASLSTTANTLWTDSGSTNHYVASTDWNDTKDDGYFVDIPVWIRTSYKEADVPLYVDAYVTTNSSSDDDDLYLAARAVILDNAKSSSTGLIEIKQDSFSNTKSIVNFMYTTIATGEAVKTVTAEGGTVAAGTVTYNTDTHYNGNTTAAVTVARAGANEQYSAGTKCWVRVWLEGEDPNCWNENAGQDFNICLKFSRDAVTMPTTIETFTPKTGTTTGSLVSGTTKTITLADASSTVLTYTYDGTEWNLTSGTYKATADKNYQISGVGTATTITGESALKAYLDANIVDATTAGTDLTVAAIDIAIASGDTTVVSFDGGAQLTYTYNGTAWSTTGAYPTAPTGKVWSIVDDSAMVSYLLSGVTTKAAATAGVSVTASGA